MERDAESHSSDKEIDRICDAFETAWRSERRPSISDFVSRGTEAQQPKLFYELLLVDLECRRNVGEQPSREEYLRAYPKFSSQIEGVKFHYGASAFASKDNGAEEPSPANSPQVGTLINHFQLVQQLGSGAMGEVWQAWDTRLRRAVAIKLPRANLLSEAELRRFQREGQAASQLKHPQLASVLDIGRWGGSPYIVVEYVEGKNLRQFLDSHQLTFQVMAEICADAAEALHHAHERGIIHRDLKPANIIVDPHGRAHVIDFGLAKWSTEDRDVTIHGELLGTPAYMSPELASGQGASAGPATDVYSLGVILYEMLTGACPFVGDRGAVLHQIQTAEPTRPRKKNRSIPRNLETICLKSLEKDPRRRYSTIQEMAVDLRRYVRGEAILARRAGVAEKTWRTVCRNPSLVAVAVLAVLVIGIGLTASSLALQIRTLLGYKEVEFTTNPPGARVAFARLNDRGELLPNEVTRPRGATPIVAQLLPGDYFVEVVWPDGSFHQVFRTVPKSRDASGGDEFVSSAYGSQLGKVVVQPSLEIEKGMTEVRTSSGEKFYVDGRDLTNKELVGADCEGAGIDPTRAAVINSFGTAAMYAEIEGKRPATSREYEILLRLMAVTTGGDDTSVDNGLNQSQSGVDTDSTPEVGPDIIRYTAPYSIKTKVRFVCSSRPRFITD